MSDKFGVGNVQKNFKVALKTIINASREGLSDVTEAVYNDSIKLAPEDTGNLKRSAFWMAPTKANITVTYFDNKRKDAIRLNSDYMSSLSYYNEFAGRYGYDVGIVTYSAYYSNIVHEVPQNHTTGQWKFLETALKNNVNDVITKISTCITRALK